jgi:hypothetical protein
MERAHTGLYENFLLIHRLIVLKAFLFEKGNKHPGKKPDAEAPHFPAPPDGKQI